MIDTSTNKIQKTLETLRKIDFLKNELLKFGIVRSKNSPLGDFSEYITCLTLELKAQNSTGYDAIGLNGIKYEIKSRTVDVVRIDGALTKFDFFVALFFRKGSYKLKEVFLASKQNLQQMKILKQKARTSKQDRLYLSINDFKGMVEQEKAKNITYKYIDILNDN
jgi:hypothetical protein